MATKFDAIIGAHRPIMPEQPELFSEDSDDAIDF